MNERVRHEERARALCACPFGIAVLYLAQRNGLSPADLADPRTASTLAAWTDGDLGGWFRDTPYRLTQAMAVGDQQLDYARAVMAAGADRWFAAIDLTAQLWLGPTDEASSDPTPLRVHARRQAADPTTPWERYAHKPATRLTTSTDLGAGETASLLALRHGGGDYYLGPPPLLRYRLTFAGTPRLYEVDSAMAWHRFAARYPARNNSGHLTPDWAGVAQDWDGVHLSLGGWLTAAQTPVMSAAGTTVLAAWEFEQTSWLNWDLVSAVRLPPVTTLDDLEPNFAGLDYDPWFDPEGAAMVANLNK